MQYFQKLIQKDLGFTHSLVESVPTYDAAEVWALHKGKSKENGDPSLVFHYNPTKSRSNNNRSQSLAKNGLMRLKTLRHPDVLKFLTSVEGSDGTIYLATEPAAPLSTLLVNNASKFSHESLQWGLFTISRALGFLHSSGLMHGRVNPSTIFLTPSGDWKLGGLECVTPHASAASLAQHATSLQTPTYQSPELSQANWSSVSAAAPSAVDSWALGCLIYEVHAGSLNSPDQLGNLSAVPKPLLSAYQKLLASNPTKRAPAGQLPNHPYFKNSNFVELNLFVDNVALKGQLEREAFLSKLVNMMDRLPDSFCTHKILPMLSQSMETGVGGSAAFACIVKMKNRFSAEDFGKNVVMKYALNWFSNVGMDRNLRVELYDNMNLFTNDMDDNMINNTVFPAMCTSFQDMSAPALRDATVKAVLSVCDRLSDKNLNSVLMSHFARLQVDPEPAIRTNTTVCLGKVSPKLSLSARNKVLVAAFIRCLKDPFPPARSAGLNALLTTTSMYNVKDMATRLLPAVVPLLVDSSGEVRKLAFRVLDEFKQQLAKNHESMFQAESSIDAESIVKSHPGTSGSSAHLASGWGLSTFTSMTAALLNKSDSSSTHESTQLRTTGISSDDFRRTVNMKPNEDSSTTLQNPQPVVPAIGATEREDLWGHPNGNKAGNVLAPVSLSQGPPQQMSNSQSSFEDADETNKVFEFEDDQDADDGWGDLDIKADSKSSGTNDLFASVLIKKSSEARNTPESYNKQDLPKEDNGDIWDLAPPLVNKSKAISRPGSSRGSIMSSSKNSRGNQKTSRYQVSAAADDWGALLGSSGSSSKRKVANRATGQR